MPLLDARRLGREPADEHPKLPQINCPRRVLGERVCLHRFPQVKKPDSIPLKALLPIRCGRGTRGRLHGWDGLVPRLLEPNNHLVQPSPEIAQGLLH